jgi:hypothetical protein
MIDINKTNHSVYEKIEVLCYNKIPVKLKLFAEDRINTLNNSEIDGIRKSIKQASFRKFNYPLFIIRDKKELK